MRTQNDHHLETFNALDEATLQRFVELRRQEDLHLEFKRVSKAGGLAKEDRRHLARSVSAFANSEGGMVIWGIDCRRDEEGVDRAQALAPAENGEMILSQLNEFTSAAASPMVVGVRHRLVSVSGGHVVATLIPASEDAPHMAGFGEMRYCRRSGSSTRRLEHYEVMDIITRRRSGRLEVYAYGIGAGRVAIGLRNLGRAAAFYPFLRLHVAGPYHASEYGVDGNRNFGLHPVIEAGKTGYGPTVFQGGAEHVIHPGCERDVTQILCGQFTEPLQVDFEVAADAAPMVIGYLRFDREVRSGAEVTGRVWGKPKSAP